MGQNRFPAEFLQQVATHLSFQDQFQSAFVCRFWNNVFQRLLYRSIELFSGAELTQVLESLYSHGYWVKELYLKSNPEKKQWHLTQLQFNLLSQLCPRLEVFEFHVTEWHHLQLQPRQWSSIRKWSPLPFATFINHLDTFNGLTHLHIQQTMIQFSSFVTHIHAAAPSLSHLTLEFIYKDNNSTIPLYHLDTLHKSLPNLHHLGLIQSIKSAAFECELTPFPSPCKLQSLTLHSLVQSNVWFHFIIHSYPHLTHLDLHPMQLRDPKGLIQMIQKVPLTTLQLGGPHLPHLFTEPLTLILRTLNHLDIDFDTYQAMDSCHFLSLVATYGLHKLRRLRLRVWEQIPGWSGVTSNLFHCHGLVSLELSLSRGLADEFPYTPFLIDYVLRHLKQLEELTLVGAMVQVTYSRLEHLDRTRSALRRLELRESKMEPLVTRYVSQSCPCLETVVVSSDALIGDLVWPESRLRQLRVYLYESLPTVHLEANDKLRQYVWDKDRYQVIKQQDQVDDACCDNKEVIRQPLLRIKCRSLTSFFLNDFKIPLHDETK
ncbi:MAG: hypothetical protein EXX96DRAFT_590781 [Benjaminiella poitrasii]|nr:MAG: hypothetical protein EXX96DRAFT_590781 [Benjaminiella poitrasii]